MINTNNMRVNTLTLLAACECNLNCSYCAIAKSKINNKNLSELVSNNKRALEDGTYLKNVKKVFNRLNQSRFQVETMEIWGQEPTMILDSLSHGWPDWIKSFPNLNYLFFSTNGIGYEESIFNFCKIVDDNAIKPLEIQIQISYDGNYGEDVARGGSIKAMNDNLTNLMRRFNNHKFSKIKIMFLPHSVLSRVVAEHVNTVDEMVSYIRDIDNFINNMKSICLNEAVKWDDRSIMFENGADFTTEYGLTFVKAIKMLKLAAKRNGGEDPDTVASRLLGAIAGYHTRRAKELGCSSIDSYVDKNINSGMEPGTNFMYCGTLDSDLKIMYDGRIAMCQNFIFDMDLDKELMDDSIRDLARYHFMKSGQDIDVLNASDEDVQKMIDVYDMIKHNNSAAFVYNYNLNMMYMLSACGDISHEYVQDFGKLKRHAFLMMGYDACYANMLYATGSMLMKSLNMFRLLCNGALDIAEEEINKMIGERNERE